MSCLISCMQPFGLNELLNPMNKELFLKSYWPLKPLFVEANHKKLGQFLQIQQLQDLESVIAARQLKVRACLPDYDDEYSSIHVEPEDALKAYRNNMTLVFDSIQKQNETIGQILKSIRSDLGLVTGGVNNNLCHARSIVYATPAGCGTRLHFDANINFIVQLHGSKIWRLTENNSVKNPTERFTAGSFEMSSALERQCHATLLDQMPDDCLEVDMHPGCVLFVPRGYWHETTTHEDSLSLNFTFSQPSWADVFTKSLHQHLLQFPEWRALADGLESTEVCRKTHSVTEFESLYKKLISQLPGLSAEKLLTESGLFSFE